LNPRFKFRTDIPYPELRAETNSETGQRQYFTPTGPAWSVTTILGSLPKPGIDAWRERVGEVEAKRKTLEATTIGTYTHNRMEAYVLGVEYVPANDPEYEQIAKEMFTIMRLMGLSKVREIWGVEVALHLENLYAGRTDLVCRYNNLPTVLDYKTSIYWKPGDFVETYKAQCAMYSMAHNWMFPDVEPIRQGVIMIGIRPNPEYNKKAQVQTIIMNHDELLRYEEAALKMVEMFHSDREQFSTREFAYFLTH